MNRVTYEYFWKTATRLESFIAENADSISTVERLQKNLHLSSYEILCYSDPMLKRLERVYRNYEKGFVSLSRFVLAIFAVKFWKSNTVFENCMGDCATWYYICQRKYPSRKFYNLDIYEKAQSLEKFINCTWEKQMDTKECCETDVQQ